MIFPRPRHSLRLIHVGLVGAAIGLTGLALWSYVSIATSPTATLAETYAARIPWLQDQAACEKTDRSWHDEQCWDNQHNPNF